MHSLQRIFEKMCIDKYHLLGFHKDKHIIARVTDELVQFFTLKKRSERSIYTVEFGIIPLCMPVPVYLNAGGYELDRFVVEQCANYEGWPCNPLSGQSIQECAEAIIETVDTYLIPFFDRSLDCKSALAELCSLEEQFENNRLQVLKLLQIANLAADSWNERSLHDSRKYYMALKSRNYDYAYRFLCHQIHYHEEQLNKFEHNQSAKQPSQVKKRYSEALYRYAEDLGWLDCKQTDYFDAIVSSNESMMRSFLARQYPKIVNNT